MGIAFPHYAKIKNNYCCCYLGDAAEYVTQLRLLRTSIEQQLPGTKLHIACRDSFFYLLENEINTIKSSEIEDLKSHFAYIRLIEFATKHPILDFMEESDLTIPAISTPSPCSGLALICPEGIEPTKSLNPSQVGKAAAHVEALGYTSIIVGSDHHSSLTIKNRPQADEKMALIRSCGLAIGVENEFLYEAAAIGKQTILVPTGIGTELYRKMFPANKIANF
jgi:hypothetical protein